ncbi:TetR family transcriptional regulator [Paenibacillus wynnii]|uniref:TetR family transcriptional regulator n=1 Tax=Paenibacillus wynnii TaxID=268407 RepID=UPI00279463DA|nr:TetR family transcriptional regulator [Paenibacillus wynnii]MDQ0195341.1 AcrR family transcriptional regulator [Paenibacillus wynnii]
MSPKISDDQKEQRRRKILEAAKLVFIDKGYEPATLKDIVEEAGMSRGWIYLYFQTKEEIFEALLDLQDSEYERYIDALLSEKLLIWDVISTTFSQQKKELLSPESGSLTPAFYEYFLTGWRDEQRRSLLMKRYENGIARFARLLQLGVDQQEFAPILPIEDIARIIASFQEGIMTHTLAVGPEQSHTEIQLASMVNYLNQLLYPK